MSNDKTSKKKSFCQGDKKERINENGSFTWAGCPEQYPVPMFTWDELNEILDENNGKIPDDMWKERIKRDK